MNTPSLGINRPNLSCRILSARIPISRFKFSDVEQKYSNYPGARADSTETRFSTLSTNFPPPERPTQSAGSRQRTHAVKFRKDRLIRPAPVLKHLAGERFARESSRGCISAEGEKAGEIARDVATAGDDSRGVKSAWQSSWPGASDAWWRARGISARGTRRCPFELEIGGQTRVKTLESAINDPRRSRRVLLRSIVCRCDVLSRDIATRKCLSTRNCQILCCWNRFRYAL